MSEKMGVEDDMLGLAVRDATMHGWRSQAAVVLLAGLVGACGGGDEASQGGGGPPQMPVRLAVATMDTVIDEIRATGQIEAVQAIELRPEVSGRLQQILVREGVEVQRGTGLFKVDDAELQAEVARLEAEMDLATQALDRTRELLARNASSEADLERAEATARSTRAQLELQQTRLRRTVVRAPFAGEVGERFVSLGDYLTPASPLTTLQTVDPQRARFDVPERYARVLAEGQSVTFSVAAIPGREFTGIVDFVDPRVRLPGRTIMVKARVANSDRSLKPGMFIEVRLATDVRAQAVVIPEEAVLPLRGSTFVWIATDENTASRVEVELGVRRPGAVEIVSGIEAGQRVVTEGQALLFPGAGLMVMGGEGQDGASSAEMDGEAGGAAESGVEGGEEPARD